MTISDMKFQKLTAIIAVSCIATMQLPLLAQERPPVTTVARAGQGQVSVLPTGPLTATTKAAAAVRASRLAQAAAASSAAAGTTAARTTSVIGYLWTANNAAMPDAAVQLRNTVTGQVEMLTKTNSIGEFLFENVDTGSYVIEYATDTAASNILAIGHPFTVAPGETVATFVRMSNAVTVFIPDVASNVATSAVQAAAGAGVTTVVTPITPVAEQPPPGTSSNPTTPPSIPNIPPAASGVR